MVIVFKAVIKADVMKSLVNVVSPITDEVKLTVKPEGVNLVAVDPSHVCMIELVLDKGTFESYEANETEMGIDLDKIKSILKLSSSGEVIAVNQDEERKKLIFKIGNITRHMSLVDTSTMSTPKIPTLNLTSYVEIYASELQKGIKASDNISDHVTFIADKNSFELLCEGDTDSASLRLDDSSISISVDKKIHSMFPLDYLGLMIKALPPDAMLKLELDTDFPVRMTFSLVDGNARVTYLLAPRIES
ncbi:MAG: DNA polymerase sliding clamp [archaeon]|nr:DNA polymerase sliding clamp [archaeon]